MNHSDIAALMKGAAPVIADLVAAAQKPLQARIDDLERSLRERDDADMVRALVADAVAAIPPAPAGKDGLDGAPGRDGTDGINGRDGLPGVDGKDGLNGLDGTPGKDGADGTNGERGEKGDPGPEGRDGAPGERGPQGPAGKLPLVKAWAAGVHYEADVVTHKGGTYQASKDTAQEPGGDEWLCLAAPGRDGIDGRSLCIRGTYVENGDYRELDVVTLNGGSFVAKRDDPGACPGEGWQLQASQGKRGQPGERGITGRGEKGEAGPPVVAMHVSDQGLLMLVNADGSTVECDLYPLLSKLRA